MRQAIVMSMAFLALFVALAVYVYANPIAELDLAATGYLQSQAWAEALYYTNKAVKLQEFRLIYVVLFLVFLVRRRHAPALIVVSAVASELISTLVKSVIGRPRPGALHATLLERSTGFSFPSGHTLEYTILFGFLGYYALAAMKDGPLRYISAGASFALVVIVGLGRVYAGAHWLTDAIGSYLLGASMLILLLVAFGKELGRDADSRLPDEVAPDRPL